MKSGLNFVEDKEPEPQYKSGEYMVKVERHTKKVVNQPAAFICQEIEFELG